MKIVTSILITLLLLSCTQDETTDANTEKSDNDSNNSKSIPPVDKSDLVHIEGNIYTEYYPDKISIKFQGPQDENGKRHGKWLYFSDKGIELSMTMYAHGDKHGHSIVKYPNGYLHYTGEYKNNQQVGIWKTYSTTGELLETKDFGEAK